MAVPQWQLKWQLISAQRQSGLRVQSCSDEFPMCATFAEAGFSSRWVGRLLTTMQPSAPYKPHNTQGLLQADRNNPPQRSQYFNSIGLSVHSILSMKFMIASSKMNEYKAKKALVPVIRPRARFSYDDLYGYLAVITWLLQLSDSIRFHVPKISFLIPGLEDLPILKDHTQASGEPKVLQQSQHRCRRTSAERTLRRNSTKPFSSLPFDDGSIMTICTFLAV